MVLELSPSGRANFIGIIAIIGVLGALVLIWRASNHEAAAYGPTAVAATRDGTVYFVAAGTLFTADAEGRLRDRVALKSLGIDTVVSHMAPLDGALLIAADGVIRRCEVAQRRCTRLAALKVPPLGGALALAVAPGVQRLYVSNVSLHRIDVFDLHGRKLYRLAVPGGVRYANDIAWLGDGRLLIADTNHHRVIAVADGGEVHAQRMQVLSAKNPIGRSGHDWPVAALRDATGRTWVIDANGQLRDGDLIVYGADGRAQRRIPLGAAADPLQLARLPGAVLVLDHAGYRLQRVALDDYRLSAFGDGALRGALAAIQARRARWHNLYRTGLGIIVLFALFGIAAGYLDWKERRQPAARRPGALVRPRAATRPPAMTAAVQMKLRPDAQGITWLAIVPRTLRWMRFMPFVISALLLLSVGLLIYSTHGWKMADLEPVGMLVAVAISVPALSLWMAHAFGRIRIGTDGHRLYLVDFRGRRAEAPPEQCLNTGRRLLIGVIGVPIANSRYQMFDKQELAAVIGPLLQRVPTRGEFTLLWQKLRRGDPATWAALAGLIAVIALRFWFDK